MRKLLIFSVVYALTTVCAGFFPDSDAMVVSCAFLAVLGMVFALIRNRGKTLEFLRILCLAFACAVISFILREDLIADPCRAADQETRDIMVAVSDYPEEGDGYRRVRGRLLSDDLPEVKLILYDRKHTESDASETAGNPGEAAAPDTADFMELGPGDVLSVSATLRSADKRYGKQYDGYYASGVFLIATGKSEAAVVGRETGLLSNLRYLPVRAAKTVSGIVSELFDASVSPFMKSLLLNDREEFYSESSLPVSFSRAGVMHIVAVSGMHVAFLVGLVQLVFGKKRGVSLLCIAVIWFFVLMTGAFPSAMRAGFMQTMLLIAPLFRRESDPPTALGFALLVLLIINPYSVKSVSLQLSFAAVAGIIVFAGPVYQALTKNLQNGFFAAILRYIIGIIATSIGVMLLTMPLTAVHFGSVSVLSVFTNILVIWAISLCFGGGFIAAALFYFFPAAGKIAAVPVTWLAKYILEAASVISGIPYATLYVSNTGFAALIWMIFVYAVFGLFRLFRRMSGRAKVIWPLILSALAMTVTVAGTKFFYEAMPGVFSAIDVGQGQSLAVFAGDKTVMIDCGSVMTEENAGEVAGKYLLSCGRKKINTLILTHLHEDHGNGVASLLEYIPVDEIILSSAFASDKDQLPAIKEAAKNKAVRITYINADTEADVGDIHLRLFVPLTGMKGNQNEKCLTCTVSVDEYDMLVTADSPAEYETVLLEQKELPQIDLLIIGHHGSKTSSSPELMSFCEGASGIVSVGYNTYGHPTEEVLQRAEEHLGSVYRTDTDGTVQLILDYGDMVQCLKNRMKEVFTSLKSRL